MFKFLRRTQQMTILPKVRILQTQKRYKVYTTPISNQGDLEKNLWKHDSPNDVVIVQWGGSFCKNCIKIKPELHTWANANPNIHLYHADVSDFMPDALGITQVPFFGVWKHPRTADTPDHVYTGSDMVKIKKLVD